MSDPRAVLGILLLHLLIVAPGAACLVFLGLLRARPRALLLAAGPAFFTGLAVTGVALIALVTVGVAVNGLVMVLTAVAVTAVFAVLARRRAPATLPAPAGGPPPLLEVVIERAVLGLIAVYFAVGMFAFTHLPMLWDNANIWSRNGLMLYYHDGLVDGVARNPLLTYAHLDYPILQPLLEAGFFRAVGRVDVRLWHAELWIVFAAGLWTMTWLLAPLGRRWLWVVVIALLAVVPIPRQNVTVGDADLTMALFIGCGALAFGLWLEHGRRAYVVLGALFVAAAASVKNEGLAFGLATYLALLLVVAASRSGARWRALGLAVATTAVCVLPWQLWVLGNDAAQRGTRSPFELIDDTDFLVDRLDFLWRGTEQVVTQLITTVSWSLLVPAFLVAATTFLVTGTRRPVAAFYALALLFCALAVSYTYWVTPIFDLDGFEQRTGPRIVLGVALVAAAGLAHLLQLASEGLEPAPDKRQVGPTVPGATQRPARTTVSDPAVAP